MVYEKEAQGNTVMTSAFHTNKFNQIKTNLNNRNAKIVYGDTNTIMFHMPNYPDEKIDENEIEQNGIKEDENEIDQNGIKEDENEIDQNGIKEEAKAKVLFDATSAFSGLSSLDQVRVGFKSSKLEIDEDGQNMLNYLSTRGMMGDQIKAYERFVFKQIPIIIKQRSISLRDGTHVVFTNSQVVLPHLSGFNEERKILFPQTARERGLTYAFGLKVDLERRRDLTGEVVMKDNSPQVIRGKDAGEIPVMLGSSLDNLQAHRIMKDDLLKLGECPHDPRGYFVVSGVERTVAIQEKLRANRLLMYDGKLGKVCRMTCLTPRGSTVVKLFKKGKDKCIRLTLDVFRGERPDIGIIQAFQILGISDIKQVIQYILQFVKEEWRGKVTLALQGSVMAAYDIEDPFEDAYGKSIYARPAVRGRKRQSKADTERLTDKSQIINKVYSDVVKSLFTQIDVRQAFNKEEQHKLIESKKILLAVMTARYAEFSAGLRPATDRNSWINKRLVTAGRLMEQLFRRLWDAMINEIENNLIGQDTRTLETVGQKMRPSIITDSMISSFIPNKWGPANMTKEANVVEAVDREESVISIFDQLSRINTPTNRKSDQLKPRSVQPSQLGYVCTIATPSSEATGLVKYKALGTWISVEGDRIPICKYLSENLSLDQNEQSPHLCILNGMPLGWCDGKSLRNKMIHRRRSLDIPFDTGLVFEDDILNVYTDGCRPTRPFLVVGEDGIPLIESKGLNKRSFHELMIHGVVEYLDVWEAMAHGVVAYSLDKLNTEREIKRKCQYELKVIPTLLKKIEQDLNNQSLATEVASNLKQRKEELLNVLTTTKRDYHRLTRKDQYTHAEIDPNLILGIAASIIPFLGSNPGPRNNFQTGMGRQALGITTSNPSERFPTTGKYLIAPTSPLVMTEMQEMLGLVDLPAGMNVVVGVLTDKDNEEDSIVINEASLQRGLFTYGVVHSYTTTVYNPTKISNGEILEYLKKPSEPYPHHSIEQYDNLDDNGIVKLNSMVRAGDCLVCKEKLISTHTKGSRARIPKVVKKEDASIYLESWEDGIVDRVFVTSNAAGEKIIKIRIRSIGSLRCGDKLTLRSAQKSTIGRIVPASQLPFTKEGVIPDILLNPHALPKRMTISTYLEIVAGKWAAMTGTTINASAFKSFDISHYSEMLETIYGFSGFGDETVYHFSGDQLSVFKMMIGPSQYNPLKHQVNSKHHCRGEGPMSMLTRQAPKGRKNGGGVRLGEQERDGLIGHGVPNFILDRTSAVCSPHRDIICKKCRITATSNPARDILLCRNCGGNEFLMIEHPYTLTVLKYYSAAAGVNMAPILVAKR